MKGTFVSKKLISFETGKDSEGRIYDGISLNNFYNLINTEYSEAKKSQDADNIFTTFSCSFKLGILIFIFSITSLLAIFT